MVQLVGVEPEGSVVGVSAVSAGRQYGAGGGVVGPGVAAWPVHGQPLMLRGQQTLQVFKGESCLHGDGEIGI